MDHEDGEVGIPLGKLRVATLLAIMRDLGLNYFNKRRDEMEDMLTIVAESGCMSPCLYMLYTPRCCSFLVINVLAVNAALASQGRDLTSGSIRRRKRRGPARGSRRSTMSSMNRLSPSGEFNHSIS